MRNSFETLHDRNSNQTELSFYSDSAVNTPMLVNKHPLFDSPSSKKQSLFRPSILPISEIQSGAQAHDSPWVSNKIFDFAVNSRDSPIHSSQKFSPTKKSKLGENIADSPSSGSSRGGGARKSTFHGKPRAARPSKLLQIRQEFDTTELRVDILEQNRKLEEAAKRRDRRIDLNEISRSELIEVKRMIFSIMKIML